VATRLKKIEHNVGGQTNSVSFGSIRRKSSFGKSTRSRIQSSVGLSNIGSSLAPPEVGIEGQRLLSEDSHQDDQDSDDGPDYEDQQVRAGIIHTIN
jgi:hypothetical protein